MAKLRETLLCILVVCRAAMAFIGTVSDRIVLFIGP